MFKVVVLIARDTSSLVTVDIVAKTSEAAPNVAVSQAPTLRAPAVPPVHALL